MMMTAQRYVGRRIVPFRALNLRCFAFVLVTRVEIEQVLE